MITIDVDDKSDDDYDVLEISVVLSFRVSYYLKSQHNEAVNKWFLEFVIFILIPEHCQWKTSIDTKLDSKGTELSVHIMVKIASIDVHIIEQGTVWSCCGEKLTDNKQKYVIIFYCRE